jgi:hypothetical protein
MEMFLSHTPEDPAVKEICDLMEHMRGDLGRVREVTSACEKLRAGKVLPRRATDPLADAKVLRFFSSFYNLPCELQSEILLRCCAIDRYGENTKVLRRDILSMMAKAHPSWLFLLP